MSEDVMIQAGDGKAMIIPRRVYEAARRLKLTGELEEAVRTVLGGSDPDEKWRPMRKLLDRLVTWHEINMESLDYVLERQRLCLEALEAWAELNEAVKRVPPVMHEQRVQKAEASGYILGQTRMLQMDYEVAKNNFDDNKHAIFTINEFLPSLMRAWYSQDKTRLSPRARRDLEAVLANYERAGV